MITACVSATSPRYIGLKYNAQTHTLKVSVIHFSPATKIHFVYRIEIDKNGQTYQSHIYQKQPGIFLLTYTYNVTAASGETLTVSAYCVLWGFLQKSMVVP
jgi:RsiW-degrading membrane proteinase PrsW (M82 family)